MIRKVKSAFTLVELLVVIGIIALLISILLPALSKARLSAQSIACSANMRSICQAMQMYGAQWKGAIMGAGGNTGIFYYNTTANSWTPQLTESTLPPGTPCYPTDWMYPCAQMMGLKVPTDVDNSVNAGDKYRWYMTQKVFLCPTFAGVLSSASSGSVGGGGDAGTVQACSYNLAMMFLLKPKTQAGYSSSTRITTSAAGAAAYPALPTNYSPKLSEVGSGSGKAYICDVAQGLSESSTALQYELRGTWQWAYTSATAGGFYTFDTMGPYTSLSSFNRSYAAGNTAVGTDNRAVNFRHGGKNPGSFRMNVGFYDGHVENMGELDACDPNIWIPKGGGFNATGDGSTALTRVWPDVVNQYKIVAGWQAH